MNLAELMYKKSEEVNNSDSTYQHTINAIQSEAESGKSYVDLCPPLGLRIANKLRGDGFFVSSFNGTMRIDWSKP